jgi:hypothetical protein
MSCQAQAGLLILRACGQPAVSACSNCGIPLCVLHAGAGTCPSCLVAGGHSNDSELSREAANRDQYYDTYGKPTEFGGEGYFSAADRASLTSRGAMGGGVPARRDDYDPLDT